MGSILGSAWLIHQIFAACGVFLGGYLRTITGDYQYAFWTGAIILAGGVIITFFLKDLDFEIQTRGKKSEITS
ncbi:hypothetical protein JMM81_13160 [Bacillus sp. V3B]|uniref:hypothetical protein n=1 Tax=Bacillus sp. V3B TaxID=2804915 RepID=UPI00210D5F98|nr:hypothetical protein [Bacillus sp. V3B]MCQ6275899.1 hypothetical protein [Bacillus sp. V3B]